MKRRNLTGIAILFGLCGLIVCSEQSAEAARSALQVCATSVIPSLFPFFVLSKLLLSSGFSVPVPGRLAGKWFGVSADCMSAFFVGLLGGYPAGAAAVADLYQSGAITKRDAEKALCFCNNSGPAFFLSFLGGTVLHSTKHGATLFLIHGFSAILCGRLFSGNKSSLLQLRQIVPAKRQKKRLTDAVSESCASLLQISGLIIFFSVMLAIAEEIGFFRLLAHIPRMPVVEMKALLCGVFELSVGILRCADSRFAFALCAFLMGWGGFCVHAQARAVWQAAGLRPKGYLYAKLLHGLLSAVLALAYSFSDVLSAVLCSGAILFCVFFPTFSKKWGRNPAGNTL